MKRISAIIFIFALCVCFFASCSDEKALRVTGDRLVDKESNVNYVMCSPSLQAVSIKGEITSYNDTALYEVEGLPTDQYLSENYDGLNYLYRADSVEEPTLETFGAVSALVCIKGDTTLVNSVISDKNTVDQLTALLETGEQTVLPAYTDSSFDIKLVSESCPYLYYRISAIRSISGEVVLYDKGTRRCVSAGKLLDEYIK